MGIVGLSTFILKHSELFLTPYELRNSYVVIDGYNIASYLYIHFTDCYSAYGGDYDHYHNVVCDFFMTLRKCYVTPIVIFDGGHEKKKLQTILKRRRSTIHQLYGFYNKFSCVTVFPIFLDHVFCNVLRKLNIIYTRCYFEADCEIAAVARALNCPVMSHDSDFFLMDVLYIPFPTVKLKPFRDRRAENCRTFYVKCQLFDVKKMLNEFSGLKKCELPLIAALLGNDYADGSVFRQFFAHVLLPKGKYANFNQKKIFALFNWLREQDLESAQQLIIDNTDKLHVKEAVKALKSALNDYKKVPPSIWPLLNIPELNVKNNSLCKKNGRFDKKQLQLLAALPNEVTELYNRCHIDGFIMDIMYLNSYFMPVQVEDVGKSSAHILSFPILSAINTILGSFCNSERTLEVYVSSNSKLAKVKLKNYSTVHFNGIEITDLLNQPNVVKSKLFYNILDIKKTDINVLKKFDNDWKLFVMAFIYWSKCLSTKLTHAHVHALVLMAVGNFIQSKVGYFRNYASFMNAKAGRFNKLCKTEMIPQSKKNGTFSEMLESVPEIEFLQFTKKFIKSRKADEAIKSFGFSVYNVHLFASFQSCLFYMLQLNALLKLPFPNLSIADFYSGTFLYRLYHELNSITNVESYVKGLLSETPTIASIYDFVVKELYPYISALAVVIAVPEKKKRRRRKSLAIKKPTVKSMKSQSRRILDPENFFSILSHNVEV